ncbi:hypothetical protein EYC80_006441 [Monilinia laxa]|uniref:Uncharacterized protein n=1 Tax=Monilinia laxa TaxID=61186 RepID=A0A5N6JUL6_MONLA|nr:hypothetical protein EYC80_006441 [Monilinia laxa]
MRLLNVITRKLEEFIGANIPKYAILSHTWGEEEVLFHDLSNPEHRYKKGYPKVEGCCQQAIQDGFHFVWIDTCCIDKSSSAELSESINSMYAWYEKARLCYAYLTDVPSGQDPYEDDSAFRQSRWFTRGWTLQELLVPQAIVFFDKEWGLVFKGSRVTERELEPDPTPRPDKKSILRWLDSLALPRDDLPKRRLRLLEDITGIEIVYFQNKNELWNAPVGLKFSWAARRTTSRPEDIAYCLLGLLKVNMPLLYGEGEKAFQRLQEEVLKREQDLSILAWGFGMTAHKNMDLIKYKTSAGYSGILAPSIKLYEKFPTSFTGDEARLWPTIHSTMTNLGLNVSLPLMCINSSLGIYLAFISDWMSGNNGQNSEAIVLPLLKRQEGQLFEYPSGTPHAISVTLARGATQRMMEWQMIYIVEPQGRLFRHRKSDWINNLDSSFFRHYTPDLWNIKIDSEQMYKAGFVAESFFPPIFIGGGHNSPHIWNIPPYNFELILVLSRGNTECCVVRVKARAINKLLNDKSSVRISKVSMARCKRSFSALQYANNFRRSKHLTMIKRPSKLKWESTVDLDPVPEENSAWASFEVSGDIEFGTMCISINYHTGAEETKPNGGEPNSTH